MATSAAPPSGVGCTKTPSSLGLTASWVFPAIRGSPPRRNPNLYQGHWQGVPLPTGTSCCPPTGRAASRNSDGIPFGTPAAKRLMRLEHEGPRASLLLHRRPRRPMGQDVRQMRSQVPNREPVRYLLRRSSSARCWHPTTFPTLLGCNVASSDSSHTTRRSPSPCRGSSRPRPRNVLHVSRASARRGGMTQCVTKFPLQCA